MKDENDGQVKPIIQEQNGESTPHSTDNNSNEPPNDNKKSENNGDAS